MENTNIKELLNLIYKIENDAVYILSKKYKEYILENETEPFFNNSIHNKYSIQIINYIIYNSIELFIGKFNTKDINELLNYIKSEDIEYDIAYALETIVSSIIEKEQIQNKATFMLFIHKMYTVDRIKYIISDIVDIYIKEIVPILKKKIIYYK